MTLTQINNFIKENSIFPADVILIPDGGYLIYMGKDGYKRNWFMANTGSEGGVSWLSEKDVSKAGFEMCPKYIRRYKGSFEERETALKKAENKLAESCALITNNCEEHADEVPFTVKNPRQVPIFGIAASVLSAAGLSNLFIND